MPPEKGLAARPLAGRLFALFCLGFAALFVGRQLLDVDLWQFWRKPGSYAERQKGFGYSVVGRFGQQRFPAVVIDRVDGRGGVVFTDPRGQSHTYSGFEGQHLKAVTFQPIHAKDKPFTIVMRRAA